MSLLHIDADTTKGQAHLHLECREGFEDEQLAEVLQALMDPERLWGADWHVTEFRGSWYRGDECEPGG